jgi:SET domain-containing protein
MSVLAQPKRPWLRVRRSPIQGKGAFAARRIPKGTRIIEYAGERITPQEAERRYTEDDPNIPVLLFDIDKNTLIDAGRDGNEARFVNHSCEPNCETVLEKRRIYIEAIREIEPGTEITYDYHLDAPRNERARLRKIYACRCGSPSCRGTMLEPLRRRRRPAKAAGAKRGRARRPASGRAHR